MFVLEIKNIDVFYGNIQALHGVSLRVNQGEIITLIGANGAGKSTTLMAISGIVPPRSGSILFEGRDISAMAADEIFKLGLCQVPEGRHIFPELTVTENLDMGAFLRRDSKGIAQDLEYIYQLFPILAKRRHQPGGNLSGGEQQMLAISRALMSRPRLLLLD
jgi:branched-chain amino acid transport system ATP-binding protein